MYMLVLPAVDVFILFCLCQQLHLRRLPDFFRNNRFMLPVCKQIVVLLHQFIFVSCATNFFRLASAIGDFPAVHRIFQNQAD